MQISGAYKAHCGGERRIVLRNLGIKTTAEGYRRTPRIHSRYKSSTRLRWWMEVLDTVAARARRVGIVVIGRRRRRK